MIDNILFLFIFSGQIYLGSYYFPKKIMGRMKHVCKMYPPSEYPKLYPYSLPHYYRSQQRFENLSNVILAIGLVILGMVIHFDFSNRENISEAIPAVYFMLQYIPLLMLEISEFSYFKQMRHANTQSTKVATMERRNLFDFVSPLLIFSALALIVLYIAIDIYVNQHIHQFTFAWDNTTVLRTINILFVNAILAGIIYWNLYGKKLDPHQSQHDRLKTIKSTIQSLVLISIFASIFMIFQEGTDDMGMDKYKPVMLSVYLISIMYVSVVSRLKTLTLEDHDFSVYKEDAQPSQA